MNEPSQRSLIISDIDTVIWSMLLQTWIMLYRIWTAPMLCLPLDVIRRSDNVIWYGQFTTNVFTITFDRWPCYVYSWMSSHGYISSYLVSLQLACLNVQTSASWNTPTTTLKPIFGFPNVICRGLCDVHREMWLFVLLILVALLFIAV